MIFAVQAASRRGSFNSSRRSSEATRGQQLGMEKSMEKFMIVDHVDPIPLQVVLYRKLNQLC